MKNILLVGGGHAHLSVLRSLANIKLSNVRIILISPNIYLNYSGMLPGWMAGHYNKKQLQINLDSLAKKAHIELINNNIIGLNADQCLVYLPEKKQIKYDLLSIDIGCNTDLSKLESLQNQLIPIRPLDGFIRAWPLILKTKLNKPNYRLVVIGGGAAGVEIALAAKYAFKYFDNQDIGYVSLVASETGLLTRFSYRVQQNVKKILYNSGISIHYLKAKGIKNKLVLSNGETINADCIIAATGTNAPFWLQETNLALDKNGYIAVNEFQRSLSHQNVFAAGDISSRQDSVISRSGVHAIHTGPILFSNLLATLNSEKLNTYKPRKNTLYILACGPKYAIASWGKWSLKGKLMWYVKSWIDKRFIKQFTIKL